MIGRRGVPGPGRRPPTCFSSGSLPCPPPLFFSAENHPFHSGFAWTQSSSVFTVSLVCHCCQHNNSVGPGPLSGTVYMRGRGPIGLMGATHPWSIDHRAASGLLYQSGDGPIGSVAVGAVQADYGCRRRSISVRLRRRRRILWSKATARRDAEEACVSPVSRKIIFHSRQYYGTPRPSQCTYPNRGPHL
jgi:hypothetical protein